MIYCNISQLYFKYIWSCTFGLFEPSLGQYTVDSDNQGHILVPPVSDPDYISHKRWTGTMTDHTLISVSQFRVCILWGPKSRHRVKAVPIQRLLQMQPANAAFFSLFLEDTFLLTFAASCIPRFFAPPKNKYREMKMATSSGADVTFKCKY